MRRDANHPDCLGTPAMGATRIEGCMAAFKVGVTGQGALRMYPIRRGKGKTNWWRWTQMLQMEQILASINNGSMQQESGA